MIIEFVFGKIQTEEKIEKGKLIELEQSIKHKVLVVEKEKGLILGIAKPILDKTTGYLGIEIRDMFVKPFDIKEEFVVTMGSPVEIKEIRMYDKFRSTLKNKNGVSIKKGEEVWAEGEIIILDDNMGIYIMNENKSVIEQ